MVTERSCRKWVTWAAVLGVHTLLVGLFLHARNPPEQAPYTEVSTTLLLEPAPQPPEVVPKSSVTRARSPRLPRSQPSSVPSNGSISAPPEAPAPKQPIDWYGEAEREGARQALSAPSSSPGADRSLSLPRKCRTRREAHWEPEPKRVGIAAGFIPYVRVGTCAIGLGIFGCSFGNPPPNGHVLDDMRNKDSDADVLDGPDCAP